MKTIHISIGDFHPHRDNERRFVSPGVTIMTADSEDPPEISKTNSLSIPLDEFIDFADRSNLLTLFFNGTDRCPGDKRGIVLGFEGPGILSTNCAALTEAPLSHLKDEHYNNMEIIRSGSAYPTVIEDCKSDNRIIDWFIYWIDEALKQKLAFPSILHFIDDNNDASPLPYPPEPVDTPDIAEVVSTAVNFGAKKTSDRSWDYADLQFETMCADELIFKVFWSRIGAGRLFYIIERNEWDVAVSGYKEAVSSHPSLESALMFCQELDSVIVKALKAEQEELRKDWAAAMAEGQDYVEKMKSS